MQVSWGVRFDSDEQVAAFLIQLAATQAGRMAKASLGGAPAAKPERVLFGAPASKAADTAVAPAAPNPERAPERGVRGGLVTMKLWRAVAGAPDSLCKGSVGHGVCDHLTRYAA